MKFRILTFVCLFVSIYSFGQEKNSTQTKTTTTPNPAKHNAAIAMSSFWNNLSEAEQKKEIEWSTMIAEFKVNKERIYATEDILWIKKIDTIQVTLPKFKKSSL